MTRPANESARPARESSRTFLIGLDSVVQYLPDTRQVLPCCAGYCIPSLKGAKPESRSSKPERSPKPKARTAQGLLPPDASFRLQMEPKPFSQPRSFEPRISDFFRTSDFGPRICHRAPRNSSKNSFSLDGVVSLHACLKHRRCSCDPNSSGHGLG